MTKDLTTLSKAKSLKGQILDEMTDYGWMKEYDYEIKELIELSISKTSQQYEREKKILNNHIEMVEKDKQETIERYLNEFEDEKIMMLNEQQEKIQQIFKDVEKAKFGDKDDKYMTILKTNFQKIQEKYEKFAKQNELSTDR